MNVEWLLGEIVDGGADADGAVPVVPRGEGRECFIVKDRMGLMGDLSGIGGWQPRAAETARASTWYPSESISRRHQSETKRQP